MEGEDGHDDAFAMLMYVLRRRLADPEDSDNWLTDDQLQTACAPLDEDTGAPSRPDWSLCDTTPGPSQCQVRLSPPPPPPSPHYKSIAQLTYSLN
jgi:hypothetical protein